MSNFQTMWMRPTVKQMNLEKNPVFSQSLLRLLQYNETKCQEKKIEKAALGKDGKGSLLLQQIKIDFLIPRFSRGQNNIAIASQRNISCLNVDSVVLFLLFFFSSDPSLLLQIMTSRWIWSLKRKLKNIRNFFWMKLFYSH